MTNRGPLPSRAAGYMAEHHEATPDEVLQECDLEESWRPQVEHYLAITRYSLYKDNSENDADDLRWNRVGWEDIAEWVVPTSE